MQWVMGKYRNILTPDTGCTLQPAWGHPHFVDRSCNEWLIFNEHLHYPHYDQLEGGWARALTKPIPHLGPLMARVQPRVHCPHRNCAVTTDNGQCPLRNNILQPAPHLVSAECEDDSSSSDDFPFLPSPEGEWRV